MLAVPSPSRLILVAALAAVALVPVRLQRRAAQPVPSTQPPIEIYVAPYGATSAAGTLEDPLDLATVLARGPEVPPGSTIWLLGGTYGDGTAWFITRFQGVAGNPVTVRAWPGRRVTLNGCLLVEGAHTTVRDLEVLSTISDRTGSHENPAAGTLDGVVVNGPYTRLIHLTVHDTREGIAVWTPAVGAEVHDCLIYNNGWQGPDRGHGHGIYTQNRDGVKVISGNIIFNQFGTGIHAYGSTRAFVRNYDIHHNVLFNNGALAREGRADNLFLGSGGSLSGIRVEENYTYHTPDADSGASRIGWQFGGVNKDVIVRGNYFIGGYIAFELNSWAEARVQGNVTYAAHAYNVNLQPPAAWHPVDLAWDRNVHFGTEQFLFRNRKLDPAAWRAAGLDPNGQFVPGRPQGLWTFLRKSEFDDNRATLVFYNWDRQPEACADLKSVWAPGGSYQAIDVQNPEADPVAQGTVAENPACFPMANLTPVQPLGDVPHPPAHTGPEFAVFVLTHTPAPAAAVPQRHR